jgi:hypothetical protein
MKKWNVIFEAPSLSSEFWFCSTTFTLESIVFELLKLVEWEVVMMVEMSCLFIIIKLSHNSKQSGSLVYLFNSSSLRSFYTPHNNVLIKQEIQEWGRYSRHEKVRCLLMNLIRLSYSALKWIHCALKLILNNYLLTHRMQAITFKDHTKNIGIWGSFLTVSLIVYFSLSSGDFSFLLVSPDSITMIKSEGDGLILCNQNAHSERVSKLPSFILHSDLFFIYAMLWIWST